MNNRTHTLQAIRQYVKDVTDVLGATLVTVEPGDTDNYDRPWNYYVEVEWEGREIMARLIVGHDGTLPEQTLIAKRLKDAR